MSTSLAARAIRRKTASEWFRKPPQPLQAPEYQYVEGIIRAITKCPSASAQAGCRNVSNKSPAPATHLGMKLADANKVMWTERVRDDATEFFA
jgi:hypothetical protein